MNKDRLLAIFAHQESLAHKYLEIECQKEASTHRSIPVAIASFAGQQRLRSIAWHIIEEMAEANTALGDLMDAQDSGARVSPAAMDFRMELIDVFLFTTELLVLCGITGYDVAQRSLAGAEPNPDADALEILAPTSVGAGPIDRFTNVSDLHFNEHHFTLLGMAMNQLKNRPWKLTPTPPGIPEFRSALIDAALEIYYHIGEILGHDGIFELYEKKCNINLRRIKDKY